MATVSQAAVQFDSHEPSRRQFYARLNSHGWDNKDDIIKYVQDEVKTIADKDVSDTTFVSVLLHFYAETKGEAVVDGVINAAITSNQKLVNEIGGPDRATPLHSTILKERMAVFEKLMALNADIKAKDSMGRLPLHYAAIVGKVDFVKHLLSRTIASRFPPNDHLGTCTQDCDGMTPLAIACHHQKNDVISYLLYKFPASCQITDFRGRTPLHISASHNDIRAVKMLLTHAGWVESHHHDKHAVDTATATRSVSDGATRSNTTIFNIDQKTNAGYTALHLACINGGLEIVELLLSHHANPTITSQDGENCLWCAVRFDQPAIVARLLRNEAICASVNDLNNSGFTLLSIACHLKAFSKIIQLLLNAGADCTKGNNDGSTPITEAIKSSHRVALGLFLESPTLHNIDDAISYKRKAKSTLKSQTSTALHFACRHGQSDAIITLIRKGADTECTDAEGLTVLHEASRLGNAKLVETLLHEGCKPNARDHKGLTPLHHACFEAPGSRNLQYASDDKLTSPSKYLDTTSECPIYHEDYERTIRLLMSRTPLHAQTLIGNSALHLAARQGHASRVDCLLSHDDIFKTLDLSNAANETPIICALEKRYVRIAEKLVHKMKSVRFRDKATRDKYLRWLIEGQEFNLVASLIHKETHSNNLARLNSVGQNATALEMAAFIGSAKVVWWLLRNSNPGPILDHDTQAAIQVCVREKEYWSSIKNERQESAAHAEAADHQDTESLEAIEQILHILQYPPPIARCQIPTPIPRRTSNIQPQSTKLIDDYRVKFMVVHANRIYQTSVPIEKALHQTRPSEIMKERPDRTRELDEKYDYARLALESPAEQQSVRWIHLPANNMQWMRDMAKAVYSDPDMRTEPEHSSHLHHSFHEVRGRLERTGYMKPQCVTSTTDSCVAVYMPFVAPAWYCRKPNRLSLRYSDLLEHYQSQGCIIHGTRTLDEYFYHFCMDSKSEESIQAQNKDQILSKVLHKDLNDRDSWILINVDQLWIWILSSEVILTSATHRRDHESDPVITVTAAALREAQILNEELPSNAFDMADFIMSRCIGSFDATFEMKPPPTAAAGDQKYRLSTASWRAGISSCPCGCSLNGVDPWHERRWPSANLDTPTRVCIKDSFTGIIAQTAMEEKALHKSVMAGDKRPLDAGSSSPDHSRAAYTVAQDTLKAGYLCREVKDMRDELKILKAVAEHQQIVQTDYRLFTAPWRVLDRPARNLVPELVDMDSAVQNMESSLSVTLTLQQNAAAMAQAEAATRQGDFMLLFTALAVIFVPPSFVTSLFAMQVETALKSPPWVYGFMLGVAGTIWLTIAAYVYYTTREPSARNWNLSSHAWRSRLIQYIIFRLPFRFKIWFAERGLIDVAGTLHTSYYRRLGRDSDQDSKILVYSALDMDFDNDSTDESYHELNSDLGDVDLHRR